LFIVQQNNQSKETIPTNPLDSIPFDQFPTEDEPLSGPFKVPTEGQALSGPFKVPSDVLKKHCFYGNCTRDLVIVPLKPNIIGQHLYYNSIRKNSKESAADKSKNEIKEKRKPTVSKNTKPKQQVIKNYEHSVKV